MAEPETKPRSPISQFRNLFIIHLFQSSVIVTIEGRRASLMFSLEGRKKG